MLLDYHYSYPYVFILLALVLRGLDILTSKETIESKLIELTLVQMKNSAIVKDNYTGVSRGFAFVEYNSIHVCSIFCIERQIKEKFIFRTR